MYVELGKTTRCDHRGLETKNHSHTKSEDVSVNALVVSSKYHHNKNFDHVIWELDWPTEVDNRVGCKRESEDYVEVEGRAYSAFPSLTASVVDYQLPVRPRIKALSPTVEVIAKNPVLIKHENSDREGENIKKQI